MGIRHDFLLGLLDLKNLRRSSPAARTLAQNAQGSKPLSPARATPMARLAPSWHVSLRAAVRTLTD
jgi:hypothetical protein